MTAATETRKLPIRGHQFRALRFGHPSNSDTPPWDTVLYSDENFVVAPTKGSLIPHWLLVIPRNPATSFRSLSLANAHSSFHEVLRIINLHFGAPAELIWFEHGASAVGSQTACGVDQAHIHVLLRPPFSFEQFAQHVLTDSLYSWRTAYSPFVHPLGTTRLDYLVFGNSQLCYFSDLTCPPKSQYFRRVVAHMVGRPRHWHYAQYPHKLNSLLTARTWLTPLT